MIDPQATQAAAYIVQTASFLPNEPVHNDEIESVLGMAGGRPAGARHCFAAQQRIRQRFYALDRHTGWPTHTNAQLTAQAVRGLAGGAGADAFALQDMACLATGTTTPDQLAPNHGVMVHGERHTPPHLRIDDVHQSPADLVFIYLFTTCRVDHR